MKRKTVKEFADLIRKKYPGSYDNVSDIDLVNAWIKKYPTYKDQIDFTEPKQNNVGGASVGGKLGATTGDPTKQGTSTGSKLGGGAGEASKKKSSGMRYTPCANLPCQFGTKNPKIREIQTCLGFPLKWQTGNFGPITTKGLKDLQYDLSKGITDEIYNTIKQNCGSANAATPDHPPLNPSGLSPDDTQPGVEGSIYNPDGTLKKT